MLLDLIHAVKVIDLNLKDSNYIGDKHNRNQHSELFFTVICDSLFTPPNDGPPLPSP
jgi:hypothetical protein